MTILSRIRARIGLLVGIIFLALLSFVLSDLKWFGNSVGSNDIGVINGHTVSIVEYNNRMADINPDNKSMNDQQRDQISDQIWKGFIDKYVYEPQYNEIGLTVTTDELTEQMFGNRPTPYFTQFFMDQQTGQPVQQYATPDGRSVDPQKLRDFAANMPKEAQAQWPGIEDGIRNQLKKDKYYTLVQKGFYVTASEAKHEFKDENTKYSFRFMMKNYKDVPDSLIKVTDDELMEYYKAHQDKYKQLNNTRSMDYVAFDVLPSADDIASEKKAAENLIPAFMKTKSGTTADSDFVKSNDESGSFQQKWMYPGQFPVGTDSVFLAAKKDTVLGAFNLGDYINIYKVLNDTVAVDSIKVRHILVAYKGAMRADPTITRSKEKAKQRADSILKVVKSGKKKMEDLVADLTDDPGCKNAKQGAPGYQGDYGWLTDQTGFAKQFMDAGFNNPVGATVIAETDFGYHVIQVIDKTKPVRKVKVEIVSKKVAPSAKTDREAKNKALKFAGDNNTGDLFTQAVQKNNMNLLKSGDIADNTRYINGIQNSKEIIQWMYNENTQVGSVSQPYSDGDRYIVCHLTKILNKGIKPFDEVRELCMVDVKRQKKAQQYIDELTKVKAGTIDQWATNAKLIVSNADNVTFTAPYVPGAGYEGVVVGTIANMKPNSLSPTPIKGSVGVYVVYLVSVTPAGQITDLKSEQTRLQNTLTGSVSQAAIDEVLTDAANVIDNRITRI